jgi:hypothetical protein
VWRRAIAQRAKVPMRRHNFNCVLDKTNNYISYDSIKTTEHIKDIAETEGTVRSIEINTQLKLTE